MSLYMVSACRVWFINECIQSSSSGSVDNFLFDDSSTTATQRTESQRNRNVSEILSSNLTAMQCNAMQCHVNLNLTYLCKLVSLQAIRPIVTLICGPLWGSLSDRPGWKKTVLLVSLFNMPYLKSSLNQPLNCL